MRKLLKRLLGLEDTSHIAAQFAQANQERKAVHAKAIQVAIDGSNDTDHLFTTLNAARRAIQGKRYDG